MPNYFENAEARRSLRDFLPTLLQPGSYRAVLKKVFPGVGRAYDGLSTRNTLTFCFETTEEKAVINRTVSATLDPRGALQSLIRQLSGAHQPSREILTDGELLTTFINAFIEKEFLVQVRPSDNQRYNNLISVGPVVAPKKEGKK